MKNATISDHRAISGGASFGTSTIGDDGLAAAFLAWSNAAAFAQLFECMDVPANDFDDLPLPPSMSMIHSSNENLFHERPQKNQPQTTSKPQRSPMCVRSVRVANRSKNRDNREFVTIRWVVKCVRADGLKEIVKCNVCRLVNFSLLTNNNCKILCTEWSYADCHIMYEQTWLVQLNNYLFWEMHETNFWKRKPFVAWPVSDWHRVVWYDSLPIEPNFNQLAVFIRLNRV